MPETINLVFKSKASQLSGMEITVYRGDELRDHGAPCCLTILPGKDTTDSIFWEQMRLINEALNATPDNFPLRASEIGDDLTVTFFNASAYPGYEGHHVLAGGDKAYIDGIRRQDVAIVATKVLREMRSLNLIAEDDYKAGLSQLSDYGWAVDENLFKDNRYFKVGSEKLPTSLKLPSSSHP